MKIKIIDEKSPYFGKEYEGYLCYYDILHGKTIDGKIQDLYHVDVDGQAKYFKSYQVDVDYYQQQEDDEYRAKYGYGKGDEVRVLEVKEVSSMATGFMDKATHTIWKISYACGLVYFEDRITCVRWPKLEVIKRADSIDYHDVNEF